jgi:release factor glutamine methyltransferase
MHTYHAMLQKLSTVLQAQYPHEEAQSIAWELIRHVTQKSRIQLIVEKNSVSDDQLATMLQLAGKHLKEQVPIAYLTGEVLFGDLTLTIKPPILIPRSETESWCYELIELLEPISKEPLRILDLCTGSGCIALALAHALPQATVVGIDINPDAIALAEENRKKLNLNNCTFLHSDLFDALQGQMFDLIVANPPYIGTSELESLPQSVRNFESAQALFAEDNGFALIKKIIATAPRYLQHNKLLSAHTIPQLLIEIGYTQGEMAKAIMTQHKYVNIALWKDYQDHNRVVCARVLQNDNNSQKI